MNTKSSPVEAAPGAEPSRETLIKHCGSDFRLIFMFINHMLTKEDIPLSFSAALAEKLKVEIDPLEVKKDLRTSLLLMSHVCRSRYIHAMIVDEILLPPVTRDEMKDIIKSFESPQ